jgi:hypothetical protein
MHRIVNLVVLLFLMLTGAACHKNVSSPTPAAPSVVPPDTEEPGAPTKPPETTRPPRVNTPTSTPPSAAAQPPTGPPPEPKFRLGQPLTPEEQRANNALIDQHLKHANQALASIGNRPLTPQQKALIPQIRGFIAQSQQMRNTDLIGARSLSEKADVLASDLLAQLH